MEDRPAPPGAINVESAIANDRSAALLVDSPTTILLANIAEQQALAHTHIAVQVVDRAAFADGRVARHSGINYLHSPAPADKRTTVRATIKGNSAIGNGNFALVVEDSAPTQSHFKG